MSVQALNWAYKQKTGSMASKSLLVALSFRAGDKPDNYRKCWPSLQSLMDETELSRSSILSNIVYLEKRGYIQRERRGGDGKGRKTNIYILNMDAESYEFNSNVQQTDEGQRPAAVLATSSKRTKGNVQQLHQQRPAAVLATSSSCTQTVKEHKTELKTKKNKQKENFETWYQNYPVKKAKKKALEIWLRIKNPPPLDHLLSVLSDQIQFDKDWQRGYIPHPTTYLNQERWNDEVQQPTSSEPTAAERTLQQAQQYLRDETGYGEALDEDGRPFRDCLDPPERRH